MMLSALILVALYASGNHGYINYGSCQWKWSRYGESLSCDNGWIATGACGSGGHSDCGNGIWNGIKCCQTDAQFTGVSSVRHAGWGTNVHCPGSQVVSSFCGAGGHADCHYNRHWYHTVIHCQESSVRLEGACTWIWGDYGEQISCPQDYVIRGKCTSEKYRDCNNWNACHGIYCCHTKQK